MRIPRPLTVFGIVVTNLLMQACALDTYGLTAGAPEAATLQLSFSQVKQFDFAWSAVPWADSYQLFERPTKDGSYEPIGDTGPGESISLTMPLHLRFGASYVLRACGGEQCVDSEPVDVVDSMAAAVGYLKASAPVEDDWFGYDVALSDDGDTLAIAALNGDVAAAQDSGAVDVFVRKAATWEKQAHFNSPNAAIMGAFGMSLAVSGDGNTLAVAASGEDDYTGGVYMFVRSNGAWTQQDHLKAADASPDSAFGSSVALSDDGKTLAVGANGKDGTGAVYVFVRPDDVWSQEASFKASDLGVGDRFGSSVAMSDDGDTLAVGAYEKAGKAGAAYVFVRSGQAWSQAASLKASNAGAGDSFGYTLAMSGDGGIVAVGAYKEGSAATGINGDQADDSAAGAGAVYVFVRSDQPNPGWPQQAYLKASNTAEEGNFGVEVALSPDGSTLAVGAHGEDSTATGIGGDQASGLAPKTGAVYVFERTNNDWSQRAYVKASNMSEGAQFGRAIAMSADSSTLAVGACCENGGANGAGAVYLY